MPEVISNTSPLQYLAQIGKENRPMLEPPILLEDPEKSHHAPLFASPSAHA